MQNLLGHGKLIIACAYCNSHKHFDKPPTTFFKNKKYIFKNHELKIDFKIQEICKNIFEEQMKQEAFHSPSHSHFLGHFKFLGNSICLLVYAAYYICMFPEPRQAPLITVVLHLTHILTFLFTSISLSLCVAPQRPRLLQFVAIATETTWWAPKSPQEKLK